MSESLLIARAEQELRWAEEKLRKATSDRKAAHSQAEVKAARKRLSNLQFKQVEADLECETMARVHKQRESCG